MNYNNTPNPDNRWRIVCFLVFCMLVVGGIVYMKRSSGEQKILNNADSSVGGVQPIAVPDTTIDPTLLPPVSDTIVVSELPDTVLGKDKRAPYEAGYEDGYAAGCDDGAMKQVRAAYDESNSFSSSFERQEYVRGYREGYAKGYDDGLHGKQFNI